MNQSTHQPPRLSLLRLGGTLLAIGLLAYLLARQGWQEISLAIQKITWGRFALALGLMFISRLAVAARWHVLLRSAGVPISPGQSLRITFAGLFASNFLPTTIGGDVVRLGGAIRLGFDQAISLASLVADRLVGMAGMALALPLILPAMLKPASASTLPSLHTLSLTAATALDSSTWPRKLIHKVRQAIQRVLQALSLWLRQPRALLISLAFTGLHMLCLFIQIRLLLDGMGEAIPLWLIAGLWSATYFVTLLPISVNGMGVQELAAAFFYGILGGISHPASLTLALLLRLLQMLASLPGALFIPEMLAGSAKTQSP